MFLERDDPLRTLMDGLAQVQRTGGRLALISGEAGIGKSTLITRFLAQLPGAQSTAVGYCDPLQTPRPLGPVRDLAATLLGGDSDVPSESRFFDQLIRAAAAAAAPLVWVIEDLHWADQKSLDWLKFTGRRVSQLPVFLIATFRDDEADATRDLRTVLGSLPQDRAIRLRLSPLSLTATTRMAAGSGLSPDALHRTTGGNPFYLTEMLNAGGKDSVPDAVGDVIHARITRLPKRAQDALELMACCPGEVQLTALERVAGPSVHEICDIGCAHRLLVPTANGVQFRHELTRRAIYDRIPPARRRAAHVRFLTDLRRVPDADRPLDLMVHHAAAAGDTALILDLAPAAARRAAEYGAHREAAQHWRIALDHAAEAPDALRAEIYESWAYEAGLAIEIDDAVIAALRQAVTLWRRAGRRDKAGAALSWLSRMHWYRGEGAIAQQLVQEAIATLEAEAPGAITARARAMALRAQFAMLQDRMEDAIASGGAALQLAEQAGDGEIRCHALNTVGSAHLFRGRAEGEQMLRDSLQIALQHGFHEQAARVYTNLSECLIEFGALDRAQALIDEGVDFDIANDLDSWTYYLIGRKAQLRFEQDRYAEALMIAEGALAQPNQTLLMQMPAKIIRARTKLRCGDGDGLAALADTLAAAQSIDEPQYLVSLHIAQIEAAVLQGDPALGAASAAWLAGLDPDLLSPRKRAEHLMWSHLAGQGVQTSDIADLPDPFAMVLRGKHDDAHRAFLQSGSRYLAGWALAASGRPDNVARAIALMEDIGAGPAAARLRVRSPDQRVRRPSGRGRRTARTSPYGLTRQEQRILGLLADGLSNAAIADHLSRSPRTVENHVSAILSKLHCRNRLDAVLRLQSEPWILPAHD